MSSTEAPVTRLTLERALEVGVRKSLSRQEIEAHRVSVSVEEMADSLIAEIRVYWLGRRDHQKRAYEKVPASWWQHLKQRWFPKWALRRWPVKTRDILTVWTVYRVCPHTCQDVPDGTAAHFHFLAHSEFTPWGIDDR